MPSRLASIAILVYWAVAAVGLARRDLIPEMSAGTPPDLLAITIAEDQDVGPSQWALQVIDDPSQPEERRNVGSAVTESKRGPDGWVEMTSKVTFDSGQLLKGTALSRGVDDKIAFVSLFRVDPAGNLQTFTAGVRADQTEEELVRIEGRLKGGVMEVVSKGPLPMFNRTLKFEYKERSVIGSKFGPLDRLPGLRVGQRWEERIANPLTGQVETVKVHVSRKVTIPWNGEPVETTEVVHQSASLSARTWVRLDGVVLRQEVPFPLLRMVLERTNDPVPPAGPGEE